MLKGKEKKEFVMLARSHMKRAFYSALGIVGNYDEAADLSQEAFIRAYNNFDKFDRSRKFFTWYYKILRNLCLNRIRDNKTRGEVSLIEIQEIKGENETGNGYELMEEKILLQEALMKLDPEEREIIVLREFENLSYDEISDLLEIPKGTVMSKLYYARKKLARKFLKNYE